MDLSHSKCQQVPIADSQTPEGRVEARLSAVRTLLASLPQPADRVITELSGGDYQLALLSTLAFFLLGLVLLLTVNEQRGMDSAREMGLLARV